MGPHKELRHTILRLLSNMAGAKEIQQYLRRFSQLDAARFAVVKVGGAVLQSDLDSLVSSLAFLQEVGLTPIVVHGGRPQIDEALAAEGMSARVIRAPELAVVRRVLQAENLGLVEALQAAGTRATSILSGVFQADYVSRRSSGLLGKVTGVHMDSIHASVKVASIPVIAALGETAGGQILHVGADQATAALVAAASPYKIIVLTEAGGFFDGDDKLVPSINLSTEYRELLQQSWLDRDMRDELRAIHDLLAGLPLSSSVSITRPAELAKELFTHRGSGTLVRRGEAVRRFTSWRGIDKDRLRVLIESGFRRKLLADYFARTRLFRAYVSEQYRAALLLTREGGLVHLDKFAVARDAQGEGLGRAAWQVMRADNPKLFWRSRPENPANDFYFEQADGCIKGDKWNVFWYGLENFGEIRAAVDHCRARPATLQ